MLRYGIAKADPHFTEGVCAMASRQRLQITGVVFFLTALACFMVAVADNPANGWFIATTENTKFDRYSDVSVSGTGPKGYKWTPGANLRAYVEVVGPSDAPVGEWIVIPEISNIWSHTLPVPGDCGKTKDGNNGTIFVYNCAVNPREVLCGPVNVRFEDL